MKDLKDISLDKQEKETSDLLIYEDSFKEIALFSLFKSGVMKNYVILCLIGLFSFSSLYLTGQSCGNTNITLTSQAEVNNFVTTYGVCDSLPAILRIGDGNPTDISDLTPLSNLTHVLQLIVTNNDNLLSLQGLENLNQSSISKLSVTGNLLLNDISQLSGIGPIGGDLGIAENPALATLDGLENLRVFGTAITIRGMPLLTTLSPMTGITRIDGFLTIENNVALTDISALSSLAIFGDGANPRFVIKNNDALEDCTPLCFVVQTVLPLVNNLTKDIQGNLGSCLDEQAILIDCIDENDGIYSGSGEVPTGTEVTLENTVSFDTSTLVIDGINNRVGIGTSSPQAVLEVDGTVKLSSLPTSGTIDKIIAIDTDGNAFEFDISSYDSNASDDFSGAFANLTGIPAGLSDGDDNTQLSDAQITALGYVKSANDADADPTNELYDDSDLIDSVAALRTDVTALQSAGGGASLYSSDGSLASNRNVAQGNFDVNFDANTFVIDGSDNKIGIGTATPTYELDVIGDVGVSGGFFGLSDARLKKNQEPITNALGILSKLNPVTYDFRTEEHPDLHLSDKKQYGLLAQDLQKVLPELVSSKIGPDGVEYLSVNYDGLIAILIQAIQELVKE